MSDAAPPRMKRAYEQAMADMDALPAPQTALDVVRTALAPILAEAEKIERELEQQTRFKYAANERADAAEARLAAAPEEQEQQAIALLLDMPLAFLSEDAGNARWDAWDEKRKEFLDRLEKNPEEGALEALKLAKEWIERSEDQTMEDALRIQDRHPGRVVYNEQYVDLCRAVTKALSTMNSGPLTKDG